MPAIRRVFLGWSRPLLHSAVDQLVVDSGLNSSFPETGKTPVTGSSRKNGKNGQNGKTWDLSRWVVVLPVVRAAKRLEELLRLEAGQQGMSFRKPRLITVGQLPELLYEPEKELASDMQQTLAWTGALMNLDEQRLSPLMPVPPPRDPVAPWVEMAGLLRRLCEDLAADGLSPADVVSEVDTAAERQRWQSIAVLYEDYLRQLSQADLADPFQQRRQATLGASCKSPGPFVLIGCVDIGGSTCRMLETIAGDVSLYIGAPEQQQHLFDTCGRVSPGRWNDFHVEITDDQLISAGDATSQAAAAAAILQDWNDNIDQAEEKPKITVGITGDAFGPLVETELSLCGFRAHRIGGTVISRTAPGRLLQRISEYLQSRTWNNFAALVRHADVLKHFAAESGTASVLLQLDQFRAEHFPRFLDDEWPELATTKKNFQALHKILQAVEQWLRPLSSLPSSRPTLLADWCQPLKSVLAEIYSQDATSHLPELTNLILEEIYPLLDSLTKLPPSLDIAVSGHAATEMILQRLAQPRSLVEAAKDDVEISGWLDLTLDDAPQMVVIGLNQPFVPQAVTSDPFLPGNLRSRLSVADNERRFARDLYVLQMMHRTRARCAFIVGRFGPDGSPTPPSRLLAACPSSVTLKRVRKLLESPPMEATPKTRWQRESQKSNLPIPVASSIVVPSEVSVTAFRAYLECPFRFYLRHVLNLRPLDDSASELAANQFGDLVHAAVERFGQSSDKDLTDPQQIENSLLEHLDRYATQAYGRAPMAAVRLQITQAERRLKVFAERQAERINDGWIIKQAEAAVLGKHGAVIECDDARKLGLKGRIDRIDFHPATGRWAILDYKTHGHPPLEKHFDKKTETWIDLQLPLYLMMLKALKIDADYENVQVGYFNIPDSAADSGIHLLELDEQLRRSAFAEAQRVAARILSADFSPQLDPALVPYDDYGMILQTGAAENLLVGSFDMEDQ